MRKSQKAISLVLLAATSVYSGRVNAAGPAAPRSGSDVKGADSNGADAKGTDVKLLEDRLDPFAAPSTQPTTNPSAAPSMLGNVDGTFSLNITNGADLVETLRVIGFQAQKSVLPSKEVHAQLPALDLYNVTVHEALNAILKVNGYVYKEEGNFIYVYSAKEMQEIEKANRVVNTEVFRMYYTPAVNAINLIKPLMSLEGQAATSTAAAAGIASGTGDVGGNNHAGEDMIIVTDYTENLDRIRKLLKDIDVRPQQILIEATILRAALTEDNALGIDFNIIGGVDFNSITSSNGQITNANTATGTRNFGDQVHSAGTGNAFSNGVGNGLKLGFVSNNVSVFLSALEGVTDTTVLANPKVLALNKQKGEVIVGNKTGYLTTTTTDTSTVQTVEFLDTGTRLIFRPFVADDGYIRMEIHPEDSSGGLGPGNLPFKTTTEVTSNIMVKDGRTIVIGGLFRESSITNRSQIPGLGNIPVAGALFRQQKDQTTREEIIILLTPHIVKDDAAYADASEALLKYGEQMRVGVRKGMMWWGRERLAESCYERAVNELSKPNPNRGLALWHLDCATNLNPKFSEAIQLKQDLTGRVLTESDNSQIRGFVTRLVLADRRAMSGQAEARDEESPTVSPTTQPTAIANAPTTQPDTQTVATVPTAPIEDQIVRTDFGSEPMTLAQTNSEVVAMPTTAPSTDSTLASFFSSMRNVFGLMSGSGPTTQPYFQKNETVTTEITELPTDDLGGGDWNK